VQEIQFLILAAGVAAGPEHRQQRQEQEQLGATAAAEQPIAEHLTQAVAVALLMLQGRAALVEQVAAGLALREMLSELLEPQIAVAAVELAEL
jgi:hypothetical protein